MDSDKQSSGYVVKIGLSLVCFSVSFFCIRAVKQMDSTSVYLLLGGVILMVCGAFLIGPLISHSISRPSGSLYFPTGGSHKVLGYSKVEAKCQQGNYTEALEELEQISLQFPYEVEPYLRRMTICHECLKDDYQVKEIYQEGWSIVKNQDDLVTLKRAFDDLVHYV